MDEFLMGIDSRFKVSMVDSTMMCILHSAMNKAHEKVRSKDGVIERLNEQSKFCELAIMQLEACLKFVQEEATNYILDNTHEKLLSDLSEIKNRLNGRLRETEIAISEKDRELVERVENEMRLRQVLEEKEKELQNLRKRSEDFCELKNSVDQQVLNIKQHLEGERIALTRRMSQGSPVSSTIVDDHELLDVMMKENNDFSPRKNSERISCEYDDQELKIGFDQMGLEIDRLKETVHTAFGMMQSAMDVRPLEIQWIWMIEKDIQYILFREFITDLKLRDQNLVSIGLLNELKIIKQQKEELDDHCLRNLITEDIVMNLFKEMVNSWTLEFDDYRINNLISKDVYQCVFLHTVKGCQDLIQGIKVDAHIKDESRKLEVNANHESLIEKLDYLLSDIEIEDLLLQISETKGTEVQYTDDELLLIEDEDSFTEISSKLEKALHQLGATKALLKELDYNQETNYNPPNCALSCDNKEIEGNYEKSFQTYPNHQKMSLSFGNKIKKPLDSGVSCFLVLYQVIANFEGRLQQELDMNNSRLENVNNLVKPLIQQVASLNKKESLYKKAFIRRCQNLQKAETEVDILGDKVDALTSLIERIYSTLDYYSPVLQHFSGVLDILVLIRKELNLGPTTLAPKNGLNFNM